MLGSDAGVEPAATESSLPSPQRRAERNRGHRMRNHSTSVHCEQVRQIQNARMLWRAASRGSPRSGKSALAS